MGGEVVLAGLQGAATGSSGDESCSPPMASPGWLCSQRCGGRLLTGHSLGVRDALPAGICYLAGRQWLGPDFFLANGESPEHASSNLRGAFACDAYDGEGGVSVHSFGYMYDH